MFWQNSGNEQISDASDVKTEKNLLDFFIHQKNKLKIFFND